MISESETLILTSAFFTLVLNMWHTCQVRFKDSEKLLPFLTIKHSSISFFLHIVKVEPTSKYLMVSSHEYIYLSHPSIL